MKGLCTAFFIGLCVWWGVTSLLRMEQESELRIKGNAWWVLPAGSLCSAYIWTNMCAENTEMKESYKAAWLVVHVYFLSSSVTDSICCQVYDVFQFLGIGAGAYLALTGETGRMFGISLVIFGLLQYFLFMKLYGAADGMAFLAAALAEAGLGYEISGFLLHMIIAYLMLSLVQLCRGNITRKGRLREGVPFLPYIMVSFWIMMIWQEGIQNRL